MPTLSYKIGADATTKQLACVRYAGELRKIFLIDKYTDGRKTS